MEIAQSVGTPGGESETQDLQPRSAQFLAGEVAKKRHEPVSGEPVET